MNPIALSIFIMSMAIGTTITISSHHWLLAWMGLEMNTLALIPVMTKKPHPRAIEAATKYFLTQATASALILFSALINAWQMGEWSITTMLNPPSIALSIALMMKLGLAPLHFWMPEVLQGISLFPGLILSSWQKIAPMTLLFQMSQSLNLGILITIGLTSTLISGWGGINQTQLRKILAYSSIGHLGWVLIILKFNIQLALLNFILYLIMTSALFLSLMSTNTTKMKELPTVFFKTPLLAPFVMLTLLSLAGLPPLTGFMPKLFIITELIKQNGMILASMVMLSSLLALFFYIRLTYVITLTLPPNTSNSTFFWYHKPKLNPMIPPLISIALLIFPLSPTILLFM
uniref:NADH-ubiquinone oxidoreductase chain 2 n=1 Tax=Wakea madinika TaxID=168683 RepID=B2DCE0_9NEOB|nr:NADH dehydrogenase subunit 2 [Wakea madinika]